MIHTDHCTSSVFAILDDPRVRDHAQLRAIRSASTADVWPITLRASGTASTLSVTVNEASGDDRTGDGSRARPFQSYERAAHVLGIDVMEVLRAARPGAALPRTVEDLVVDVPLSPGPQNRHERRTAKAIARRQR